MNKLVILDSVFDDDTITRLAGFDYGLATPERWYEYGVSLLHEKIVDIAREYFDLSTASGYEMWRNDAALDWHRDKDEIRWSQGIQYFPLCSIVYYAKVDNLSGGEFMTNDIRYIPVPNRLVMFSPGIFHRVDPFDGTRLAISINPWAERPLVP